MVARNYDWDELAKRFLEGERSTLLITIPPSFPIFLYWKFNAYIGSLQEPFPDYSREIVLLSKSSNSPNSDLIKAIKKLDKKRLEVTADSELDLTGRQHLLRRIGPRLTIMTPEQTEYAHSHLPPIIEI
jgi:hypothetical protein